MANNSIRFLLMVLLGLGTQLLLAWLVFTGGRRIGARRGPLALVVLASSVPGAWLLYHRLPEQLPICTDSLLTYLQCLGF
ncbi:MAG: hypothetical protein ACJ8G3_01690 [Burkholderiaceae bacterium]